jgi:hypothetical protein
MGNHDVALKWREDVACDVARSGLMVILSRLVRTCFGRNRRIRRRGPSSQTWQTFLRNHAHAIAAIDLCVVPTLTFECLFVSRNHGHRRHRETGPRHRRRNRAVST